MMLSKSLIALLIAFLALVSAVSKAQTESSADINAILEYAIDNYKYEYDEEISLQLPRLAQHSVNDLYLLLGDLPPSLSYNQSTRTIRGYAQDIGEWHLQYFISKTEGSLAKDFLITITPNRSLTREVHWRRALQFSQSSADYIDNRLKLVGREIEPFKQSDNKNEWAIKVDLKLAKVGAWEKSRTERFYRYGAESLQATSLYETEGVDLERNNYITGLIDERTQGYATIRDSVAYKTYQVELDYKTVYTGYKGKDFSFWLASSYGDDGSILYKEWIGYNEAGYISAIKYSALSGKIKSKVSRRMTASFSFIKDAKLSSTGYFDVVSDASSYKLQLDWKNRYSWRLTRRNRLTWSPTIKAFWRMDDEDGKKNSGFDVDVNSRLSYKQWVITLKYLTISVDKQINDYHSLLLSWSTKRRGFGFKYSLTEGYSSRKVNELYSATFLNQVVSNFSLYQEQTSERLELYTNETLLAGKKVKLYYKINHTSSIFGDSQSDAFGFSVRKEKEWRAFFEQQLYGYRKARMKIEWWIS